MFKRENRLVPGISFRDSYSISIPQFIFKQKKNWLMQNRFGVVVSKKVDKRAVVRNKIKRMFRSFLLDLNRNVMPGHDILFIIRPEIKSKTKEENKEAIESALRKAELIK